MKSHEMLQSKRAVSHSNRGNHGCDLIYLRGSFFYLLGSLIYL